ncbi:MAG TPA: division/cell wall cluster transcriptional repressor MraZ [Caldilineaceae bacterium]|nr:division/cell wall cluster transcriptional repressor MraZ [Caldilineaceae bacterium]
MFLGEYSHSLDSKARLTVPARYREALAHSLVVTRHPTDRCLMLFPMPEWERVDEKINSLALADPKSALLRRLLFGAAEELAPDKQGRILLSQRLREYAQIETEILVIGMSKFIELWDPANWESKVTSELNNSEVNAELFAALNI